MNDKDETKAEATTGGVRLERVVRPTARWATTRHSKNGTGHLFDFESEKDRGEDERVMKAACGHYRSLLIDLQPEDQIIKKCARCLRIKSA